ncbi:lactate permease [Hesseltinella vesiculosa]|uniref:Lactate permease n=1 Tax=Hesseltinella vesiculosa TaxID=101127 RepID=A0A1X2GKE3_9FUNG|nr:lactate permease [Hesseltinella vesiculosa]
MSLANVPPVPQEIIDAGIFVQELAPIRGSLVGSFFVGVIPLLVVLVMLGVLRIPAHYASATGLIVCIFIAIFGWHMPAQQCFESIANGIVYANWPIMWIVVNAMIIFNVAVVTGIFDLFRRWIVAYTPGDQRVVLLIIGYAFGALLEGVAGFGTPGAICSAMLVSLGFEPIDALTYTLIFDTTPVAFGALGIPITTLATLTKLSPMALSAMAGRQLPLVSLFLPTYALTFFAGFRAGLLECWPLGLVAGLSFAVVQAIFSNLVGPELPDLIAGVVCLLSLLVFVQFWKPPYRPEFVTTTTVSIGSNDEEKVAVKPDSTDSDEGKVEVEERDAPLADTLAETNVSDDVTQTMNVEKPSLLESVVCWSPWVLIIVIVIIWSFSKASAVGQVAVHWPNLHERVWITLYGQKYAAIWNFQPMATGTAILVSGIPFHIIVMLRGHPPKIFAQALVRTVKQLVSPVFTVSFIIALAYLYNFSGIAYTVGLTLSSVGRAFPFLSAWLGWLACFLSGSDTSANSLFGNLQVVAAREIGLSTVLMAATNSSGAVCSKMISPQNLTTGVTTIGLRGKEGLVLRRTILHSIIMVCCIGVIACVEQYGIPGIIPPEQWQGV